MSSDKGRKYMEKIVQAGYDLPTVPQEKLEQALLEGLFKLRAHKGTFDRLEEYRWEKNHPQCLLPFFRTLRDVRRYLSCFSFELGLFIKNGCLEVNIIDLIGLETLRVFEPEIYHGLAREKDWIFGNSYRREQPEYQEEQKDWIKSLISSARDENQPVVKSLLSNLFPQVDALLRDRGPVSRSEKAWEQRLQICHEDYFDRYFKMSVPKEDVPMSLVLRVIEAQSDKKALTAVFKKAMQENRIERFLLRLVSHVVEMDIANADTFVTALFDVGNALSHRYSDLVALSAEHQASRVIREYILREESQEKRGSIILEALKDTTGIHLPVSFVFDQEPKNGEYDEDSIFSSSVMEQAKTKCLEIIQNSTSDDSLLTPQLEPLLLSWSHWTGREEPRAWLTQVTDSLEGAIKFLNCVVYKMPHPGDKSSRSRPTIWLQDIENFIDMEHLRSTLAPVLADDDKMSSKHQRLLSDNADAISAFRDIVKLMDKTQAVE